MNPKIEIEPVVYHKIICKMSGQERLECDYHQPFSLHISDCAFYNKNGKVCHCLKLKQETVKTSVDKESS